VRTYTAADIDHALALTVYQPWSHLISRGLKPVENREHQRFAWYRQRAILIHAGKTRWHVEPEDIEQYPDMPFGAIECVAWCVGTFPLGKLPGDLLTNEHAFGPYCMVLEDVYRLPRPVAAMGAQGLWKPPAAIRLAVAEQLGVAA
jgi:hypothetical protein